MTILDNIAIITRILLSLGLVFMIYKETGIWTAIAIGLISINLELTTIILKIRHII
jgi:hypothetical protein